jgi:hypothetical protein
MALRIVVVCLSLVFSTTAGAAKRSLPESHFFVTSDHCIACHSGLHDSTGADVSIGYDWRSTIMANSARDPYFHAAVRRESIDHPSARAAIEDKCSTCHMPMARFDAAAAGGRGEVFANLPTAAPTHRYAFDGVSCTVCHQIAPTNLGEHSSFDGGFEIAANAVAAERPVYGPHAVDDARRSVMQGSALYVPSQSEHIRRSELCATCHTLYTAALDADGKQIGELPEQMPYQEWLNSEYRDRRSCQSCHMPRVPEATAMSAVLGDPAREISRHTFRGGNAFMLGILNANRGELGVAALPQELDAAVRATRDYLATAAGRIAVAARVERDALAVDVEVVSTTGHKLPTGYPSRRAWLHVTVSDDAGRVVFESGAVRPDGSIVGNDNDDDAGRIEPHYTDIASADQVQIYEAVMVDAGGRPTTGLLSAVRYAKDNRLLPRGFAKDAGGDDIAVRGAAANDADFVGGGDRTRYRVALDGARGALHVRAELLYQSIGYRWAANLATYDAAEPRRFSGYYNAAAPASALPIAKAEAVVSR